ncbi:sulfite exporter TauE/SafE family protein [Methylomonas rivi]|uniref:Sulfite exporter TauE/SafE family protein n=1 Tax=Methylomonas rivi TaxID=2952226 RepID=A0ABT1U0M1_9GAMM|nr:sulfite exporter TauE/SafE family protein [Methylomonas sp. WSC-6]MBS4050069.1 sulfite exporter TauE/SafE family protein [Methylomonas sp.]MCQ8127360.1 sulfite exporter TauE/SafE family protein [Methylomonas sp. WSC-6]
MHLYLDFNASYLAAFFIGLFSSLHCIGMCGSIIGTLTYSLSQELRNNKRILFSIVLSYNLGRIASYAIAGAVVGFLSLPFTEGQAHRILQLASGAIMASAGLYIGGWFPRFAYIEKIGSRFWKLIEPFGRRLIPVKTRTQAILFGMVWGWLPCGLIYTALALAATTGNVVHSSMTMLAFGLGTLPAVVGVGIMTSLLARLSKARRFKQVVGILFIIFALLAVFPWLNPMRVEHI